MRTAKSDADAFRGYAAPAEVLNDPELDSAARIEVLQAWERHARQLLVATGEGMEGSGHAGETLQAVHTALSELGATSGAERSQTDSSGSPS